MKYMELLTNKKALCVLHHIGRFKPKTGGGLSPSWDIENSLIILRELMMVKPNELKLTTYGKTTFNNMFGRNKEGEKG